MSKDDYVNPETEARYENAFKQYAKGGKLDVLDILDCLKEAKEENYTFDDVVDALEVMRIKNEPLSSDQFKDLIGILKDPETIIDAFKVFDPEEKGVVIEHEIRGWLHTYAPDLKGKEIEDVLERPQATKEGATNYQTFVDYWSTQ